MTDQVAWRAALRDFAEEFAFRYDDYALARDEELTRSTIDLKRRLRELVKQTAINCGRFDPGGRPLKTPPPSSPGMLAHPELR